ncbi:TPA: trypsin-like peptidase domain-containing protein [Enterobacter hormaechei]|nr:trypsin-like peptidase domain-containing protein [Enterobacter hormaechei]DAL18435.1 MAG TPA_asm: Trypsin-like peptidase domain [Caudoviricetes sp.]HAS0818900.1 trypsin-like peptidase domain-containing protein [Enterobacter hormaechei subsp. xiangfangensis]MBL6036213.1 trypsin-like peptidase domain-containing protein [Enterobacter hormaechei]MBL6040188.1 trypsin-like peptidase domain-containing protein [Enterobacter hormaechei]
MILFRKEHPKMQNVHGLSLVTTLVNLRLKGRSVSIGTGFFYKNNKGDKSVIFLATNYHVITGIGPSERGVKTVLGDEIAIQLRDKAGSTYEVIIPLFIYGYQNWLEHPTDDEADIVLIPLPAKLLENADFSYVSVEATLKDILLSPSSPVVMIGYPHGYRDTVNNLPIWKTGNLASEPEYDFDGKKVIVVDISAYPGMSGSPAFFVSHNGYATKKGEIFMGGGMAIHFLGVYASMQMLNSDLYLEQVTNHSAYKVTHSESLQLGHVWKAALLEQIADGFEPDDYPNHFSRKVIIPEIKSSFEMKF